MRKICFLELLTRAELPNTEDILGLRTTHSIWMELVKHKLAGDATTRSTRQVWSIYLQVVDDQLEARLKQVRQLGDAWHNRILQQLLANNPSIQRLLVKLTCRILYMVRINRNLMLRTIKCYGYMQSKLI
jgi:hypothetical protein